MQRAAPALFAAVIALSTLACGSADDGVIVERDAEGKVIALRNNNEPWTKVSRYCFPPGEAGDLSAEICRSCVETARAHKANADEVCGKYCEGCEADENGETDCGSGFLYAQCR